jgi:hypothetical protein
MHGNQDLSSHLLGFLIYLLYSGCYHATRNEKDLTQRDTLVNVKSALWIKDLGEIMCTVYTTTKRSTGLGRFFVLSSQKVGLFFFFLGKLHFHPLNSHRFTQNPPDTKKLSNTPPELPDSLAYTPSVPFRRQMQTECPSRDFHVIF